MPEPDWPHRNVWRPNPPASSRSGTPLGECELSHVELRAVGARTLEPGAHLLRGGATHQSVVERAPVAMEDDAIPAAGADADLPERRRGGVLVAELERQQLAQAGGAIALERDVATRLQLQPVQRHLEGEAPPVNGGRERQHGRLERAPHLAILLERSLYVRHGGGIAPGQTPDAPASVGSATRPASEGTG